MNDNDNDIICDHCGWPKGKHRMTTLNCPVSEHRIEWRETTFLCECPHDEHDHGICLSCGKDINDDLVGRAEAWADAREDR